MILETNGNSTTGLMHLLVFHELHRMRVTSEPEISEIVPEKSVLLETRGFPRLGRFDFFVRAKNKSIGIEVLTRPTHGKLKEKLCYSDTVNEFVFVLPNDSFELYKKPLGKGKNRARLNFFDSEFRNPKLKVWLVDTAKAKILVKTSFNKIFNVE